MVLTGACSSGERATLGGPTLTRPPTPTLVPQPVAPPSAAIRAATVEYLAAGGAPVLAFERATDGLVADPDDALTVAQRYAKLIPTAQDHNHLMELIGGVPDPVLKERLYQDFATRELLLEMGNPKTSRVNLDKLEQLHAATRAMASRLSARLSQFGLSVSG